jgi:hypothetical protein
MDLFNDPPDQGADRGELRDHLALQGLLEKTDHPMDHN